MYCNHAVKKFCIDRFKICFAADAGIIHKDIDTAENLSSIGNELDNCGFISNIARSSVNISEFATQFARARVVIQMAEINAATLARKGPHDCCPYAAATTCDDGAPPG